MNDFYKDIMKNSEPYILLESIVDEDDVEYEEMSFDKVNDELNDDELDDELDDNNDSSLLDAIIDEFNLPKDTSRSALRTFLRDLSNDSETADDADDLRDLMITDADIDFENSDLWD
jgi:hypothetical protein